MSRRLEEFGTLSDAALQFARTYAEAGCAATAASGFMMGAGYALAVLGRCPEELLAAVSGRMASEARAFEAVLLERVAERGVTERP